MSTLLLEGLKLISSPSRNPCTQRNVLSWWCSYFRRILPLRKKQISLGIPQKQGMTTNLNDPSIDRQIQHHTNQSHTFHVFFPSNIPVKEWREFVSIEYSTTFEDYPPSLAVSRQYLKWPKHLAWSVPPTVKQYRPPSVWSLPQPFQQVDTCLPSKWVSKKRTPKRSFWKNVSFKTYTASTHYLLSWI